VIRTSPVAVTDIPAVIVPAAAIEPTTVTRAPAIRL